MRQSAGCLAPRARQRRLQIQEAACRLVIDRGYDGFTMDDLAAEVGVSRRTLFNHASSKEAAVLGPFNDGRERGPRIDRFTAGGPSGDLLTDLVDIVDGVFADVAKDDPDMVDRHLLVEQAVACDTRLQAMVQRRFEGFAEDMAASVCAREGWPPGDLRSTALTRTLLSLIRLSLEEAARRRDATPLNLIFHEVLSAAQAAGILTHSA